MMRNDDPPDKSLEAPAEPGAPPASRVAPPPAKPPRRRVAAALAAALGDDGTTVVDDPSAGEVESTSDRQKKVDPGRESEVDTEVTAIGARHPDGSTSLLPAIYDVKPFPSDGRASDVSGDKGEDGSGSGDARGRVVPFRRWTRATLSSVATLFDVEGVDLRFDTALGALMLYASPPWAAKDGPEVYPRPVKRLDELRAAQWISEMHSEDVSVVVVSDAMRLTAANPTRQVDSVQAAIVAAAGVWDGVPRIDSDLATRLGLDDRTQKKQTDVARWFVASVRRMVRPGAPLEDVLLVEEAPSLRATVQALAALVPAECVLDTSLNFDCRFGVAAKRLVGKALVVVADIMHHTPRELEMLVSFAATPHDGDDLPPRHAGFALVGTGRRQDHIPARCVVTKVHHDALPIDAAMRRQWLAEALARIDDYVPEVRPSLYREKEHPWEVPIWKYLTKAPLRWVTTNTILHECLKMALDRREARHHQDIAKILTKYEWTNARVTTAGEFVDETAEDEAPPMRGSRKETRIRVWVPPAGFYAVPEHAVSPVSVDDFMAPVAVSTDSSAIESQKSCGQAVTSVPDVVKHEESST